MLAGYASPFSRTFHWRLYTLYVHHFLRDFSSFNKKNFWSKLGKSLKSHEHEVVFRGNIVPCNNTIMWKHNQLCNIVQSFRFMPVESKQNVSLHTSSTIQRRHYRNAAKFMTEEDMLFLIRQSNIFWNLSF